MKKTVTCGVLSVPIEALPYKYNESADRVRELKQKLLDIFVQTAKDRELSVISGGDIGFSLWSLEIALAAGLLGYPVKPRPIGLRDEYTEFWAESWRNRYDRIKDSTLSTIDLFQECPGAINSREDFFTTADKFIVDNSDKLIIITAGDILPAETEYAKKSGKPVTYLT